MHKPSSPNNHKIDQSPLQQEEKEIFNFSSIASDEGPLEFRALMDDDTYNPVDAQLLGYFKIYSMPLSVHQSGIMPSAGIEEKQHPKQ